VVVKVALTLNLDGGRPPTAASGRGPVPYHWPSAIGLAFEADDLLNVALEEAAVLKALFQEAASSSYTCCRRRARAGFSARGTGPSDYQAPRPVAGARSSGSDGPPWPRSARRRLRGYRSGGRVWPAGAVARSVGQLTSPSPSTCPSGRDRLGMRYLDPGERRQVGALLSRRTLIGREAAAATISSTRSPQRWSA
jgi:hypothetical protein